jgi:hypothetical protein
MKKLIFITGLILLSGFTIGQSLQKGNLIGTHVMTVNLQPGVTMDKFMEFYSHKAIPEFEKYHPGWKMYLVKSIRGEIKNGFGLIFIITSEKDRDKYYNNDGSPNELGKSVIEKMNPVMDEMNKYGTVTTTYTDWLVI